MQHHLLLASKPSSNSFHLLQSISRELSFDKKAILNILSDINIFYIIGLTDILRLIDFE